jgi:hypothetical protein
VATKHDGRSGSGELKSPLKYAASLLGFYAAMHLAVGGMIHLLTSPAAAAVMPSSNDGASAMAVASTLGRELTAAIGKPSCESSNGTHGSRDCDEARRAKGDCLHVE